VLEANGGAVLGFEFGEDGRFVLHAFIADEGHLGIGVVGREAGGFVAALGVGAFHPGGELTREEGDEVAGEK